MSFKGCLLHWVVNSKLTRSLSWTGGVTLESERLYHTLGCSGGKDRAGVELPLKRACPVLPLRRGCNSQHVHKVAEKRLGPPELTQQKSNKASTTFPFWKQPGSQGMTGHRKGWCSSAQDYFSTTKLMNYSKSFLFFIFFLSGNKPKALSVEGTCSTSEPHLSPSLEGLHQTPRARRGQSSI